MKQDAIPSTWPKALLTSVLVLAVTAAGTPSSCGWLYESNDVTAERVADCAELLIDADTMFEVNGQSAIPDGLFGVTAYRYQMEKR